MRASKSKKKQQAPRRAKLSPPRTKTNHGAQSDAPLYREVFFRPERKSYVLRVGASPSACVFCATLKQGKGKDSLLVHQTEHAMIILNKFPYNSGHLLVLPKRHCGDLLELTPEEGAALHTGITMGVRCLLEIYKPNGFNIGLNLGAASGAGIPQHLHYHVIPRWGGDTNFFPLIAGTKVVIETLEDSVAKVSAYFAKINQTSLKK